MRCEVVVHKLGQQCSGRLLAGGEASSAQCSPAVMVRKVDRGLRWLVVWCGVVVHG